MPESVNEYLKDISTLAGIITRYGESQVEVK